MPQPTTQVRWTQDTRTAFLLALRLTGTVMRAAAAIGRQPAVCYKVRERDAAFRAAWDAIVAEQRAGRRVARRIGPDAVGPAGADIARDAAGHRLRRDGLTVVKRRAFLRALSETGTVEAACRAAGVSDTAAYNLRSADAEFAAAWDRALRASGPVLDQVVWERAVEGWEEPVFAGGKQVGTRRRFSETLLRHMVIRRDKGVALANDPKALVARAREAAKAAGGVFATYASEAETNAAILKQIDRIEAEHPLSAAADWIRRRKEGR